MWPDKVLRQFAMIPQNALENQLHPPYSKLLHTLFHPDSDFVVGPLFLSDPQNTDDFILYEIRLVDKPVLILVVKPPSHLGISSKRQLADEQIRRHMRDVAENCPLKTLHAISAIGTMLCFYSVDTENPRARIQPTAIRRFDPEVVNDVAPEDCWAYDILGPSGEERFRAVVEEIKTHCAALSSGTKAS